MNIGLSTGRLTKIGITLVFSCLIVLLPFVAYAGFLSFMSGAFKTVSATPPPEILPNSQNMILLQATISPNPDLYSGDISVDHSSLLPERSVTASSSMIKNPDQIITYIVRSGDTLESVAKMFNVTKNTIVWSNNITGGSISPGDELVILPISGVRYTVKNGDTVASVAKKFKGDPDTITQFNELSRGSVLVSGDTLIIPDGEVFSEHTSTTKTIPQSISILKKYLSAPVYDGYYMRPLIGGSKTQGLHGHNGIDLASRFGADILASASGKVIVAKSSGWNGGYGSYIVLQHDNGTQTLYGHLSGVKVSVGDLVTQGQVIGNMGSTGESTGTHLHFEIRGARNPF